MSTTSKQVLSISTLSSVLDRLCAGCLVTRVLPVLLDLLLVCTFFCGAATGLGSCVVAMCIISFIKSMSIRNMALPASAAHSNCSGNSRCCCCNLPASAAKHLCSQPPHRQFLVLIVALCCHCSVLSESNFCCMMSDGMVV